MGNLYSFRRKRRQTEVLTNIVHRPQTVCKKFELELDVSLSNINCMLFNSRSEMVQMRKIEIVRRNASILLFTRCWLNSNLKPFPSEHDPYNLFSFTSLTTTVCVVLKACFAQDLSGEKKLERKRKLLQTLALRGETYSYNNSLLVDYTNTLPSDFRLLRSSTERSTWSRVAMVR